MILKRLRVGVFLAGAAAAIVGLPAATASAATEAVSGNWSGYVAGGANFSSVASSWVQPSVNCSYGSTYSAYWIGLGGASGQGDSLEQTGTQADCTSDGQPYYYAWYELVPAAPVTLGLNVRAGDQISARVSVNGSSVSISLADRTTGQAVTRTLPMSDPDTSSADWIAEAPSACDQSGNCQPLPLSNFGTVTFTNASATADGHTGPISDSAWTAQPVALDATGGFGGGEVSYQEGGAVGATPSALSSNGSSFSVTTDSGASAAGNPGSGGGSGYGSGGGSGYGSGGGSGYGSGGGSGYGSGGGSGYGWGGGSGFGWGGGYAYVYGPPNWN